jgi:hypothetical protein
MTNSPNKAKDAVSVADAAIDHQTGGAGEQTQKMRALLDAQLSVTDDKVKTQPKAS